MDAALNIVQNPASNVMAVYRAASPSGPFQPTLTSQPHDWTMSITYNGGGLNLPGSVAVDSKGNVAVADYFGSVVSKFSPTGVPAATSGFPGTGLRQSYGIAIDGSDNLWVTNEQSVSGAGNSHDGSVSEFSATSGTELSGYGYTAGSIYYPVAAATDSDGTVWIADYGSSGASLLNVADGSAALYGSYAPGSLPFTTAVAVDASHNAWFAIQGGAAKVTPGNPDTSAASTVNSYSCCASPTGIAIDPSGNVWLADYNASEIFELNSSGTLTHSTVVSGGSGGPEGIAVDGAGNIWAANYFGNSLAELAGSNASVLSPSLGYGLDAPLKEPYGLAIDASGNVWTANAGSNTLTQFVGIASPVKTPLLGPSVQP
jgi:streptogramin lyase